MDVNGSHQHPDHGSITTIPFDTVHKAFENIVDHHPEVIAAVHDGSELTYSQLDVAANRLANYLTHSGLRPGQPVCLVVQRSLEMMIAILAILKAGCHYVPIDGGVVSEKALQHILQDTEARFVLCLPRYWDNVRRHAHRDVVILELGTETGAFYSCERPSITVAADDSLYIMYTSGSTGLPKGVDVKHRAMTNALLTEPCRLSVDVGSKVAQVLSISFAMGGWEMLVSIMNGGTLYLRTSDWERTLKQVDTLICTPSILSKYTQQDFSNIQTVAVAGEPCSQTLADAWGTGRAFYNCLGSTEVFVVSADLHNPGESLSIGRPLPNVRCYILDDDHNKTSRGEKGTLWVGGAGVSRGYLNLPLTTAERFKPDRFANDGFMYNFGNVVSWRANGSLESFGRLDDQVKIKGFRVELDGVTAIIAKFDGISQATSVIIDDKLYGFYTSEAPIDEVQLDTFVRQHLPYYSVPEKWTRLDVIPLNPNGKVDKIKLKASAVELCEVVEKINVTAKAHVKHDSVVDAGKATTEVVLPLSAKIQDTLPPSPAISQDADVEEGLNKKMGSMSTNRSSIQEPIPALVPGQLPHPKHSPWQTWLRYRVFIAYRWLLLMIILVNCGIAAWLLHKHIEGDGFPLSATATATAANLTAAVLIRSEPVINLLFTIFSSVPRWMPLIIRRACAQIYHLGGVHSGCAIASLIWFLAFTVGASLELGKHVRRLSLTPIILSYIITSLLLTMSLLSCPGLRAKYHNLWEKVHRFGGWTILLLYWILVGFTTRDLNVGSPMPLSEALARNPSIWLISVATAAIIFPWLFLRRVPVSSEVLSSHAIRLHFKYTDLSPGFGVRLAEHPMGDWHGFATITNADKSDTATKGNGFSVIVSRAGDFTGRTIDTAPKFIWKRGIPTCGVLRIASLFKSVVIVATGSGIGPCLSVFKFDVKMRILWTAPNHEATFGSLIVDDVRKRDPQAVIHNTRTQGKPDMALMTHKLYKESGAEAVLVISNKRLTTQIVYEMERRGIPAYGAIFDS